MLELDVHLQLDDFTLRVATSIPSSGVTALFGPSGSGKTTLLRSIAGFDRCAGTIALDGNVWLNESVNLSANKRPVGYVFQETRLFPHLSVQGNLRYAEKRRNASASITMSDVIAKLDLPDLLQRNPLDLSGGEAKRVALARTLLSGPELLLLDEPLSGLDQAKKSEILPYLERVSAEFEVPTLFVSHVVDEVARLADHVVVLQNGQVEYTGDFAAFLQSSQSHTLTPAVDAGVTIPARVIAIEHKLMSMSLEADGHQFVTPATQEFAVGSETRLFIRARDVAIALRAPTEISVRNILPVEVQQIDIDESTPFAEVSLLMDTQVLYARITRAALADLDLAIGQSVYALIKSVSFDR